MGRPVQSTVITRLIAESNDRCRAFINDVGSSSATCPLVVTRATSGSQCPISAARAPESRKAPLDAASATSSRPVASNSHVRGSVSTTFGGLPRRWCGSRNALHRNERRHAYLDAGSWRSGRQCARGQPHRVAKLRPPGLRQAVVAQPVGDGRHGGACLRRIDTAVVGHTLDSQSARSTATDRPTRRPARSSW